jgi:hypothetical protein
MLFRGFHGFNGRKFSKFFPTIETILLLMDHHYLLVSFTEDISENVVQVCSSFFFHKIKYADNTDCIGSRCGSVYMFLDLLCSFC